LVQQGKRGKASLGKLYYLTLDIIGRFIKEFLILGNIETSATGIGAFIEASHICPLNKEALNRS